MDSIGPLARSPDALLRLWFSVRARGSFQIICLLAAQMSMSATGCEMCQGNDCDLMGISLLGRHLSFTAVRLFMRLFPFFLLLFESIELSLFFVASTFFLSLSYYLFVCHLPKWFMLSLSYISCTFSLSLLTFCLIFCLYRILPFLHLSLSKSFTLALSDFSLFLPFSCKFISFSLSLSHFTFIFIFYFLSFSLYLSFTSYLFCFYFS